MSTRSTLTAVAALAILAATAATPMSARADESTKLSPRAAAAQARSNEQALQAAQRWAQRNPERYSRLFPPGSSFEPGSLPITYSLRGGGTGATMADSLLYSLLDLGHGELMANHRDNLGRLYTLAFAMMPVEYRAGLPDPSQVTGLPKGKLVNQLRKLAEVLTRHFGDIRILLTRTVGIPGLPVNPIGSCSAEVGWEAGGVDNENSARCDIGDYASLGLMKNLDFVLKDDLTCVKDQRARGSCVAHAAAAHIETLIQVQGGAPENLSEQDLYFWAKVNTSFDNRYNDGLTTGRVYDELVAQGFEVQYEAGWNYNQSPGRTGPVGNQFTGSCDLANYTGEMCTEYAFQAFESQLPSGTYVYLSPPRASTGWQVNSVTDIVDLLPGFQIELSIIAVETEFPVVITFNTVAAFRNPDANGYVQYNPLDNTPTGKHAVLAVGFVANADLPAGVPADPDGLGYFVIKNSWGTGYGDCGFAYVSTEYLRQWGVGYFLMDKTLSFN